MLYPDPMRHWRRLGLCSLLCLAMQGLAIAQSETPAPKTPTHTSTTPATKTTHHTSGQATGKKTSAHTSAQKSKTSHTKKGSKQVAKKKHGQQAIDPTRAREIQTALIREHYMQGEPTGAWDTATQAAMQRYQADQGWQSKTTPDSRALIKLGLGPSHDHLLNPESAMTQSRPMPAPAAPPAADPKSGAKQTPPDNNLPQQ
jgi:Putative peptidoglycan binding domain